MRIFTDISFSKGRGDYQLQANWQALFCQKTPLADGVNRCFANRVSQPYEEILDGATLPRSAPGARHELICARLHAAMAASVANLGSTQLLAQRTKIPVTRSTAICPDLALITTAMQKLFLAVEIVQTGDHHADTVIKKEIYENARVPRLWMVDPRYDNVEIYHSTEFGLALKGILAGKEILSEKLIPEFQFVIAELFAAG
jgi:Uma2 family endonuclease